MLGRVMEECCFASLVKVLSSGLAWVSIDLGVLVGLDSCYLDFMQRNCFGNLGLRQGNDRMLNGMGTGLHFGMAMVELGMGKTVWYGLKAGVRDQNRKFQHTWISK